ncbi:MAG: hypothetical protein ACRDLB_08170 [Actinomycetota bacterium]
MKRGYVAVAAISMTVGMMLTTVGAQAMPPWDNNPLFGESEGASQVTGINMGVVSATSSGTFHANHFGSGTYTAVTTQNYPRHVESGMENPMGQCAFVDGTLELTAANGDVLNVDVDADRSVTCAPPDQPPTGAAEGDVYTTTLFGVITGGTGRFAEASGFLFSEGTSVVGEPGTTVDEADIFGDIAY